MIRNVEQPLSDPLHRIMLRAAPPRTFSEGTGLFSEVRPIGGVSGATPRLKHLFHLAYPRSGTDLFSYLL